MLKFHIITIFPHILDSYFSESILSRAIKKKLITVKFYNLRDFTPPSDQHKSVDDKPYGGGPGMIFKIEPLYKSIRYVIASQKLLAGGRVLKNLGLKNTGSHKRRAKILLMAPSGKRFYQRMAQQFSLFDDLIFICCRYEGYDARVEKIVDEKISIGDYVLSGGELPAAVIAEAATRLVPGVLGKKESLLEETFNTRSVKSELDKNKHYQEYPQYTRPEIFSPNRKSIWRVPKVLLSGDHEEIRRWRKSKI